MEKRSADEGLEERLELSLLYDFYGALLKENQQRMFEAYILEDYNFSEIAAQEEISRQGVYDAIKRASRQLWEFEGKLGLAARFEKQKSMVQELWKEVQGLQMPGEEKKWEKVFRILENILEES